MIVEQSKNICSSCGLETSSISKDHNNPWACITALKHRNFELQKALDTERQARFDWLNNYIWQIRPNHKFKHLASQIRMQFFTLRDKVDWMDGTEDLGTVKQKATELFHTIRELLREVEL